MLVKLLSAIAWPVTAIILALIFRAELRQVMRRLSALSYKDAKAEFKLALEEIEGEIRNLPKSSPRQTELGTSIKSRESLSDYQRLLRIAEISPRAAVMEAWREVEIGTKQVTDAYGIATAGQIAGVKAIQELVNRGLLPSMLVSIYERLRRLRSRAAHAPDFIVEEEQAERFIDAANHFYETFRFLLQQAEDKKNRDFHPRWLIQPTQKTARLISNVQTYCPDSERHGFPEKSTIRDVTINLRNRQLAAIIG